jgi:molybdate transport system permease protein
MPTPGPQSRPHRFSPFWLSLSVTTGLYLLFLLAMLAATATYSTPGHLWRAFNSREIRYSICLSLATCTTTALLSLLLAVPIGYLLSRGRCPGRAALDAALDIPLVLPPMVIGLCLLIFFQTPVGHAIERITPFTYSVAGIILAQLIIGAAFAIRTMHGTFDHLSARPEEVALTLGCSRGQAVWLVTLPAARRGMFAAASVAWARSLGEFGPILVFAGATRFKTEVLPTTIWLELSVGNLEAAVAVSILMVGMAMAVLLAIRLVGERL